MKDREDITFKGVTHDQAMRLVPKGTILCGYRGSVSHGTYTPEYGPNAHDDKDLVCVYVGAPERYLGFAPKGWDTHIVEEVGVDGVVWDMAGYEARKMIGLLSQANPNVLSLLWLPEHLYVLKSPVGELLIENRNLFATKRAYKSFCGYANGQLHRMTHPSGKHMGKKRRELVCEFGFDTKNASHLIRILRMGVEFLSTGELDVVREDAPQLIEIKRGEWPLEKVEREAERLFAAAESALIHSPLPAQPDMDAINKLCVQVIASGCGFYW